MTKKALKLTFVFVVLNLSILAIYSLFRWYISIYQHSNIGEMYWLFWFPTFSLIVFYFSIGYFLKKEKIENQIGLLIPLLVTYYTFQILLSTPFNIKRYQVLEQVNLNKNSFYSIKYFQLKTDSIFKSKNERLVHKPARNKFEIFYLIPFEEKLENKNVYFGVDYSFYEDVKSHDSIKNKNFAEFERECQDSILNYNFYKTNIFERQSSSYWRDQYINALPNGNNVVILKPINKNYKQEQKEILMYFIVFNLISILASSLYFNRQLNEQSN